jgi:hypothetical protein
MPGYLVSVRPDGPLPIPGTDATVTFKAAASYGDDLHCDAVAAQYAPPAGAPLSEDELRRRGAQRTHAYVLARTVAMIVAWDLTDEGGQPLPVTPESLKGLSVPVGGFLALEARKRFEGRSEEEERPFARPSPELSEAEVPATPT